MRIVLLCATERGYQFLEKLTELVPKSNFVVFSFREEPGEPPFIEKINHLTVTKGGEFYESKNVGASRWNKFWETSNVDLMLVVSWRYMIPPHIYNRPRMGTYVFHDSYLPEYRGFSPTVWAVLNDEDYTGVTLFKISQGVDEGDFVDQQKIPIGKREYINEVMERVTDSYLNLLERNLFDLLNDKCSLKAQDHSRATYTCKRLDEDNLINWNASSRDIYNLIRAVSHPYQGAYTYLSGKLVRIWAAEEVENPRYFSGRVPGRVVEVLPGQGSMVLTGDGVILITKVQLEQGNIVCASEVLDKISLTLKTRS